MCWHHKNCIARQEEYERVLLSHIIRYSHWTSAPVVLNHKLNFQHPQGQKQPAQIKMLSGPTKFSHLSSVAIIVNTLLQDTFRCQVHDHLSYAFKSGIITSPLFHSPKACVLLCTGRGGRIKTWSTVQNLEAGSTYSFNCKSPGPSFPPGKSCFPAGLKVNWLVLQRVPHSSWGSGSSWAPALFLDWHYVTNHVLWHGWTLILATKCAATQERDGNVKYHMLWAGPF